MKTVLLGTLTILLVVTTNAIKTLKEENKVIGGINVKQGDYPFMVSVHQDTNFLCAGVLIDVFWVLTSGICVHADQLKPLKVSVGGVHFIGSEVGRYDINVADVIMHDNFYGCTPFKLSKLGYVPSYYYCNNLALLKLSTPAMPSTMVQPIILTDPSEITPANVLTRVVGWGGNDNNSPSSTIQVSNSSLTISTAECTAALGIQMTELDVCTEKNTQDTCEFDQGGPLFKWDSRGIVLIGIVNYAPCGAVFPNVFASTTGQRWWIQKVTGL